MKIETDITPRDLKLITVVGSIAIVVVLVWAGVQPLWNRRQELVQDEATQQQRLQEATDPSLTTALQDSARTTMRGVADNTLRGYQTGLMDASEANALATSLAADHGLHVISVSFSLPTQGAYAAEPSYMAGGSDDGSDSSNSGSVNSTGTDTPTVQMNQDAQSADTGDLTGIYQTNFQLNLSGTRENLQGFIDDVAQDRPGMRVQQFQWTQADVNGSSSAAGSQEAADTWHLAVNLAVYSYEGQGD